MRQSKKVKPRRKGIKPKAHSYNKLRDAIFVHKLKHGLTSIKWSLKMVLSGDFGELNDEQKDIVEKDLEETERLIVLANNLLTDGDNAKTFLNKNLYDAEQIVYSAIESCTAKALEKKIKLEFIKPEGKIEAFFDKEKIKISIQNILDNAIKFTHEGGKIIVSMSKNTDNLEIKVQDFGIGIPEKQKSKLFTKFFRGTNAIGINKEGSGLGLFIAKNIVHAHDGKIWFESKEGEGSTFYVELPIKGKK